MMTDDRVILDPAAVFDIEFETDFTGRKTSEGDGRTAADIEREEAEALDNGAE